MTSKYEQAADQIRSDLRAGAVSAYIDGDTAQEYLGELIRLHQQHKETGESLASWVARVSADLDAKLQSIIDQTVELHVHEVADELSRGA